MHSLLRTRLLVAAAVGIVLVLSTATLIVARIWKEDLVSLAHVGTFFGIANAVFSGLAFAAVFVALLLQKEELGLQRHELELTRQVLTGQTKQLEDQARSLRSQTAEGKLFHLLQLQVQVVAGTKVWHAAGHRWVEGRSAFLDMLAHLKQVFVETKGEVDVRVESAYRRFFESMRQRLWHYFRGIKTTLQHIDSMPTDAQEAAARALRAQMSDAERSLMLYHVWGYSKTHTLHRLDL